MDLAGYPTKAFANAEEFSSYAKQWDAGCLILDVRMPGKDGLTLQREIRQSCPILPVILLTAHGDVPMAVDSMRAGAWHFVEKPYDRKHLLECVRRASDVNRRLRQEFESVREIQERMSALSPREREVADRIADGMSTVDIAEELGLRRHTVAHQRASLFQKMSVDSPVDLANRMSQVRQSKFDSP